MRTTPHRIAALALFALAAFPAQSQQPLPTNAGGEPPPPEEIIRRFAAQEAEFKLARDNYTYKQSVVVQEYTAYGELGGKYERRSEIVFTPEGKRFERVTWEPPSTLEQISISREDIKDLESIQPFVLTTDDLPKYNLEYRGREKVDEITTYVFLVSPKRIEPGQRYFEGMIWVDDQDLQIVKTRGKAVPDIRKKGQENLFPEFETYRENIDEKFWFPTYTRADDVLHFKAGDVRIKVVIRYTDYKQFRVTSRIPTDVTIDPAKPPE